MWYQECQLLLLFIDGSDDGDSEQKTQSLHWFINSLFTNSSDDSDSEQKTLSEAPSGRIEVLLKRRNPPGD